MSLFPQLRRRHREPRVYISLNHDGTRSVSIHGGNAAEVTTLMNEALHRLDHLAVTAFIDGDTTQPAPDNH